MTGDSDFDLVGALCRLMFGALTDENKEKLRKDMLQFVNEMPVSKRVTRQAINKWFLPKDANGERSTSAIRRGNAFEFLYNYLLSRLPKAPDGTSDEYDNILNYLKLRHNVINNLYPGSREMLLSDVMEESSKYPKITYLNDLFEGSPILSEREIEQSYFLLYRRSTVTGRLFKTFMVCKPPQEGESSQYTFVQFVRQGNNIYRESYGIIMRMETSYYWLGSNYSMRIDKGDVAEAAYERARMEERKRPFGLELIAAQCEHIDFEKGLFGAVITTVGPNRRPIGGDVAFLHLGTQRSLDYILTDKIVQPRALRTDELEEDLIKTVARMREVGCRKVSRLLELATLNGETAQLAQRILDTIGGAIGSSGEMHEVGRSGQIRTIAGVDIAGLR